MNKKSIILYYFKSKGCLPCQAALPKIKHLLKLYSFIQLQEIDIHEQPELSGQLLVFSTPFIVIIKNNKEIARLSGLLSINVIREKLNILAKNYSETSEL